MPEFPGTFPGLVIVAALVVLALGFGLRQWIERGRREADLPEADARYFARQDARRLVGSTLMLLIAAGMTAGLAIDPRADPRTGRIWGLIWLVVSALVISLLVLGLADWFDLRAYAGRQRRVLDAERQAVIDAERKRLADEWRRQNEARTSDGQTPDDPHPLESG